MTTTGTGAGGAGVLLGIVTELGVDVTVVPLQSKDAVIVYVFSGCRPLSKNTKSLSIGEVRLDPDKTAVANPLEQPGPPESALPFTAVAFNG